MSFAQSGAASRTGELYAGFEVLNGNGALSKVYVLDPDTKSLADATAEFEECLDQQAIPQIGSRFLQQFYLSRFEICLHRFSVVVAREIETFTASLKQLPGHSGVLLRVNPVSVPTLFAAGDILAGDAILRHALAC